MLPNQVVAAGVKEDREAPRILEGDQAGFSGIVIDVHDVKLRNLFPRHFRTVNPSSLLRIQDCNCISEMTLRIPRVLSPLT